MSTDTEQLFFLVHQGCIPALCSQLDSVNDGDLATALESIHEILLRMRAWTLENSDLNLADMVRECGGAEKVATLQNHSTEFVSEVARNLYEMLV
mmetsp:Transcript_8642/g.18440  ORF Transcript_8642/g.18440 Transcript_8642/m.18440 type:complete len:95 (+) Transcript_8642:926-1210(+)